MPCPGPRPLCGGTYVLQVQFEAPEMADVKVFNGRFHVRRTTLCFYRTMEVTYLRVSSAENFEKYVSH